MLISEDKPNAQYLIKSFNDNSITINEITYTHSLIITPSQLHPNWEPKTAQEISEDNLAKIITLHPDIVIIGTGKLFHNINPDLTKLFSDRKIGVEVMNTPAACRTYMALLAENRNVIAGLILDD